MRKKIIGIILGNCLIMGILLGCGVKEDDSPDAITASENVEELEAESDFVENSDYSSYLNKIWCMNGENPEEEVPDNDVPVSLVITQIEKGFIQGYFDDTAYVYAHYFRLSQKEEHIDEFYGTIYDGTAECRCYYKDGKEGRLTITFCGDDRIEAVLDGDDEKRCLLRPYHITDADYLYVLYGETIDYEAELGVWGTVTGLTIDMSAPFTSWKTGSLSA